MTATQISEHGHLELESIMRSFDSRIFHQSSFSIAFGFPDLWFFNCPFLDLKLSATRYIFQNFQGTKVRKYLGT